MPRAALVIGHPGHELRLHGWLVQARPLVCVLTDGSGRSGHSRLAATTAVLEAAGAQRGPIYGRLCDRAAYDAILDGDHERFVALAGELADMLVAERIDVVVGDAAEGFNPTHDVCRLVIDAAVDLAARARPRIASYEFPLDGPPDRGPIPGAIRIALDEPAFTAKLAAARRYDALADEVGAAIATHGADAFRVECLSPVVPGAHRNDGPPPFYERWGELRVEAGHYPRVLRRREHVVPLAVALARAVARGINS